MYYGDIIMSKKIHRKRSCQPQIKSSGAAAFGGFSTKQNIYELPCHKVLSLRL